MPSGEIVYLDSHKLRPLEKPLLDESIGLAGKPDFIVRINGVNIPLEVKSNSINNGPFDSHIMQLAAYCRLTHTATGRRPPYGILKYRNIIKKINYTESLEYKLLSQLDTMRTALEEKKELHRYHNSISKCKGCGFSNICDERLI